MNCARISRVSMRSTKESVWTWSISKAIALVLGALACFVLLFKYNDLFKLW
jgi:hypothetical protein